MAHESRASLACQLVDCHKWQPLTRAPRHINSCPDKKKGKQKEKTFFSFLRGGGTLYINIKWFVLFIVQPPFQGEGQAVLLYRPKPKLPVKFWLFFSCSRRFFSISAFTVGEFRIDFASIHAGMRS
ncbi:Uncharacterised protein [Campylobacter geochelonis]|nr:Uncharacterised protein [Campylobacter geochelonis]